MNRRDAPSLRKSPHSSTTNTKIKDMATYNSRRLVGNINPIRTFHKIISPLILIIYILNLQHLYSTEGPCAYKNSTNISIYHNESQGRKFNHISLTCVLGRAQFASMDRSTISTASYMLISLLFFDRNYYFG
jgi:hypothetical protein